MSNDASSSEQAERDGQQRPATLAIYESLPPDPIRCSSTRKRWPRIYVTTGFATVPPSAPTP